MARTKQTARKSEAQKVPRKQLVAQKLAKSSKSKVKYGTGPDSDIMRNLLSK